MLIKNKKALLFVFLAVFMLVGCSENNGYEDYPELNGGIEAYENPLDVQYVAEYPNETESTKPELSRNEVELIEYYILTLTSKEFAGRMPGTPGNDLAVSWLMDKLVSFGIEPYDGADHKVGYVGRTNTFERSEMIITYQDSVDTLVQGVDFFISLSQGSFSKTIYQNSYNYSFLGIGDTRARRIGDDCRYFVYFQSREAFLNTTYRPGTESLLRGMVVQLSDEIYYRLQNGQFDSVEINNTIAYDEMQLYHVVGRIRGANSLIGVVLSAHFDHMGEGGATFFPGALDNASGTAALLYIAQRLKTISEENPFEFDIIIAFFNSEEHAGENMIPDGSQHFIPILKNDYETIFNINIDGVGLRDGESYMIGDSAPPDLLSSIEDFFADRDTFLDRSRVIVSDNMSFTNAGLPSVSFTSSYYHEPGIAHTNIDTIEFLSISQILRLGDMIVDFIAELGCSVFIETNDGYEADYYGMSVKFADVFARLRAGEYVRFYDEFYVYFPRERQHFFTYCEIVEYDERIAYISSFCDYTLRVVAGSLGHPWKRFLFFNSVNPDAYDLVITFMAPESIETMRQREQLTEVADLPGFYTLRLWNATEGVVLDGDRIFAFVFTDGKNNFSVRPLSRFEVEPRFTFRTEDGDIMFIQFGAVFRTKEEITEVIHTLQLHEFVEGWRKFSG